MTIGIRLLLVVGLELAGHMMVLVVLGIAAHPRAQTHRSVLLNCGARTIDSGAVTARNAPSCPDTLREDIACDQCTFTV